MGAGYFIGFLWFQFVNFVAFILEKLKLRVKVPSLTDDLTCVSALSLAKKIRLKEVSSEDVVKAFIQRIKEVNSVLNCVVEDNFSSAVSIAKAIDEDIRNGRAQLDKPFLGVPFTVKDCIGVQGLLCTAGIVARKNSRMDKDATVIKLMKEAGGILLAITNVSEVCMWWESNNKIYGRTNNPYDQRRIVGGSSGGEAAILACGGSPMGIGSDIGGSIRMPSFFCGIFGHKPSPKLVSDEGCVPPVSGYPAFMHTAGPMSRFSEDLGPMLKVLSGSSIQRLNLDEPVDMKKIRFYYMSEMKSPVVGRVDKHQRLALKKVIRYFETKYDQIAFKVDLPLVHSSLGLWLNDMEDQANPKFSAEMLNREGNVNAATELFKWLINRSNHTFPAVELALLEQITEKLQTPSERERMVVLREKLVRQFQELLSTNGVFLFPTHPTVAPLHNQPIFQPFNFAYTSIFNSLALPTTQVPLGLSSTGIPVGIQVVAARDQDRLCLALACELEKAFGGWVKP